ncbi:MAG: PqqD family protein [Phycisphaerae bacterium]|nr:PqqD family protein [Phycisphaerae bacterium]
MSKQSALTRSDLLDAVPVRNEKVSVEKGSGGGLVLGVPLRERWYMKPPIGWVMPFSRRRRVALDRLGMAVWETCDGRRTVEEVVEAFAARHHLTFHEARVSVEQFLRELVRRGLVVLTSRSREGDEP